MLRSLYLFSAVEEKFRSLGMVARRVRGMNKNTFVHKYLLVFSNWVSFKLIIFSFEIQRNPETYLCLSSTHA